MPSVPENDLAVRFDNDYEPTAASQAGIESKLFSARGTGLDLTNQQPLASVPKNMLERNIEQRPRVPGNIKQGQDGEFLKRWSLSWLCLDQLKCEALGPIRNRKSTKNRKPKRRQFGANTLAAHFNCCRWRMRRSLAVQIDGFLFREMLMW
ncbi:hypothetical protein CC79DRAFT_1363433 [Sarocladium strictum]